MGSLTDYIEITTLQQLQDRFVAVAQVPIRICDAQGEPLTKESRLRNRKRIQSTGESVLAQVDISGDVVARLEMIAPTQSPRDEAQSPSWRKDILHLMAGVIGGLYDRQRQLQARIEQLATLYTLTAAFAGQRDLQSLLDLVAKTVVDVLHAKGCSIRLLNEEGTELVIKAVANLSRTYLDKGPILLSESQIDQEVISSGKPLFIEDERTDPRVLYPKEARREGIVSALCAPMTFKDRPEGAIRVYMGKKHIFDWFEISLLQAIAAQAAAAIATARLNEEAIRALQMERALAMAADVQRQMIPSQPPKVKGLEISTVYVPCYELGGDFFDFIDLPNDNLGIVICDVAGKGVRASLLMASIRASLRAHISNIFDMSQVISAVNRDLCSDTQVGDFATLFYGVMDMRNRRFTYINAGHLPPLLLRGTEVQLLSTRGALLGVDMRGQWPKVSIDIRSGDVLLAFTDGLTEAFNFEDEPFGRQRVQKAAVFAVSNGQGADGVVKHALWEMRRFTGLQNRCDDLTIVGVRVL